MLTNHDPVIDCFEDFSTNFHYFVKIIRVKNFNRGVKFFSLPPFGEKITGLIVSLLRFIIPSFRSWVAIKSTNLKETDGRGLINWNVDLSKLIRSDNEADKYDRGRGWGLKGWPKDKEEAPRLVEVEGSKGSEGGIKGGGIPTPARARGWGRQRRQRGWVRTWKKILLILWTKNIYKLPILWMSTFSWKWK